MSAIAPLTTILLWSPLTREKSPDESQYVAFGEAQQNHMQKARSQRFQGQPEGVMVFPVVPACLWAGLA